MQTNSFKQINQSNQAQLQFKTCTALITPFDENNKIDFESVCKMIEFQIENKIDAILILGTTGEAPTVNNHERTQLIKFVVQTVAKRCLVLVGTGSNCTKKACQQTRQAKLLGVDGVLVVSPFYNKCTQNGLIEYYKAINKIGLPFIVYNVPTRTGLNIAPPTIFELEKLSHVAGTKEANGNIDHIIELLHKNTKPVYSGNDKLNHVFNCLGGNGCISVVGNVFPNLIVEQFINKTNSLIIHNKLLELNNLLFCEVNPIGIKFAMSEYGFCKNLLRAPLTKLQSQNEKILKNTLKNLKNY